MTDATQREQERIKSVARLLHQGCRPLKVLSALAWPPEVKTTFLDGGSQELPRVSYPAFDPTPTIEAVREARRLIVPVTTIDLWFDQQAQAIELAARMLAAAGTPAFFDHARQLYGEPTAPLRYLPVTPIQLAHTVQETIAQLAQIHFDLAPPAYHSATEVAKRLKVAVKEHFGDQAPSVDLVDQLSANALATSKAIRVRRDARFTDRDFIQLLHHEAHIHVATSINGKAQTDLPILGDAHPGTTRTQEGLAVFAELVSGSIELDRLRRLADRVITIQMAIDGADFLDVYRYYLEKTSQPDQSFESARRVFRGGVITGGAPFTKDVVYLTGLLSVNYFIRACFAAGRADAIHLLFCGKLDLFAVPALCELYALGLCRPPRFLPPWISDPRYLLATLTFSTFANRHDLEPLVQVATKLLDSAPVVRMPANESP
ncbi:MAG: flavohemoglobin expression-modulating QEGLA motif protein [Bdellovibrio bacteriovorus]